MPTDNVCEWRSIHSEVFCLSLEAAGELKRISQPVATELEITEIADREMKKVWRRASAAV